MRLPGIQEETAYGQILGSIYFSARQVRISKFTEDKTYMLNINDIVVAFKKENKDEFLCLVAGQGTCCCKDAKILDMFEIINPGMTFRLTDSNGKRGILILSKEHRGKYKIIDFLMIKLEGTKKNGGVFEWKEIFKI